MALALLLSAAGCQRPAAVQASIVEPAKLPEKKEPTDSARHIRATGTIQAVRAYSVQVPRIQSIQGQDSRVTLVKLAPNGTKVSQGDVLAEFDRTRQLDEARDAQAKYEDLMHQVRQKAAENSSEAEKRSVELKQAEADLGKALIQLRKGPVLSEIDRLKNEAKAESARARTESLKKIDASRKQAEAAALRILELKMERQKVALERAQSNSEKLVLRAPIAGMVALENLWRGGSMGNAQEGDQLWQGQTLLKIFDPGEMEVLTQIGEPDGANLKPGAVALVQLDAYPDTVFRARFHSASPVATSAMGSPIKNFAARFRLEQTDPRLLPDLSAAVVIRTEDR